MQENSCDVNETEFAIVAELVDEHVGFECNLVQIDAQTWAIHGTIAVDGEVILAEFSSREVAQAALERLAAEAAALSPRPHVS